MHTAEGTVAGSLAEARICNVFYRAKFIRWFYLLTEVTEPHIQGAQTSPLAHADRAVAMLRSTQKAESDHRFL